MRRWLFAGSFDPFTIGHQDIARRALELADELVIAIGYNEAKKGDSDPEERRRLIVRLFASDSRVTVTLFSGLAVEEARRVGAEALVRGVRSVADFDYERNMADVNRRISGIETVLLLARPELGCISSSVVRELRHNGYDVSEFLPKEQT